jgi:hypothetical protein
MNNKPANDYAYRQVLGSLERRGAKVNVSSDGLRVTGVFSDPNAAEYAWIALSTKYPPASVKVERNGLTLTFNFAAEGSPFNESRLMKKTIKLNTTQLRSLIKEAIQGRQPGSPLWEAPGDGHPLDHGDSGISPAVSDLIEQLAQQVAEELADAEGMDPGDVLPEISAALNDCITKFYSGETGNW